MILMKFLVEGAAEGDDRSSYVILSMFFSYFQ